MKKIVLAFIAVISVLTPAFSVEIGAIISEQTDFKFNGNGTNFINQSESLLPYMKAELFENATLSIEASFQHKFMSDFENLKDNSVALDLSLLKFEKIFKLQNFSTIQLSLGRMNFCDSTGLIFSQTSDGLFFKFASMRFELAAYGGYTGLLNIKNNSILMSDGNVFSLGDEKIIYDFAAPYIISNLSFAFPYLFLNQSITLELSGAFASAGVSKFSEKESSRFYATLSMNGALAPSLFYSFATTFQTVDFANLSLLEKFNLDLYTNLKNLAFGFSAIYASGNNGALKPFTGVSLTISNFSNEDLPYSDIFKTGLSASIKPIKNIFISTDFDLVFRTEHKFMYYGFQMDLGFNYQIFSDVQVLFLTNMFFGADNTVNRTELVLGLKLAL